MNDVRINDCPRADGIISYIYGEIEGPAKERFEEHLSDCMICTDDFAAIADSRFSVFEWHREEFVPLPTPEFAVPKAAQKEAAGTSIFAAFADMIRNAGRPAMAAASVLLFAGVVFTLLIISDGRNEVAQVSGDENPIPAESPLRSTAAEGVVVPTGIPAVEKEEMAAKEPAALAESARSRVSSSKKTTSRRKPSPSPSSRPSPGMEKAPVLSSYEVNEDRSLRLSDLMDEIGG